MTYKPTTAETNLRLPAELLKRLFVVADKRGTTVVDMLDVLSRNPRPEQKKTNKTPVYLNTKLDFGKYRGLTMDAIIRNDLMYAEWLFEHVVHIHLQPECIHLMDELNETF